MYRKFKVVFIGSLAVLALILLSQLVQIYLEGMGEPGGGAVAPYRQELFKENGKDYKAIDVPIIGDQSREYPTGCESASSVMLLKYWGIDTNMEEFINQYLPKENLTMEGGRLTGPGPDEAYIGDPRESSGYGCYAPVIVTALERAAGERMEVRNETGASLEELAEQYIKENIPVLIWATVGFLPSRAGAKWHIRSTGEEFTWPLGEHCLVLVGYDQERYYFNDPYEDKGFVGYEKELVRLRYEEMGKQAVVMVEP